MSGAAIDWDVFLSNIRYFYDHREQCEVYIKTVDAAVRTEAEKEKFYQEFETMCDKISIEHIIPAWAGYDKIYRNFNVEKAEGLHGHKIREVEVCPIPFYSLVVNPDGEVTACCADWKRGISMGHVQDESLYEIWTGEKYRTFLADMLKDGRSNSHRVCASCDYPMYDAVDNIDIYRKELLKKFEK